MTLRISWVLQTPCIDHRSLCDNQNVLWNPHFLRGGHHCMGNILRTCGSRNHYPFVVTFQKKLCPTGLLLFLPSVAPSEGQATPSDLDKQEEFTICGNELGVAGDSGKIK